MIIVTILSALFGIFISLVFSLSLTNMYIYKKLKTNNDVSSPEVNLPQNKELDDFLILSGPAKMTIGQSWYSETINNPRIIKGE